MKLKVKMRTRWSLEEVMLFVALFCVSTFALLEHVSISIPLFSYVKKPILYLGGFCLLSQIKLYVNTFLKKKYFYVHVCTFFFCLFLLISAFVNRYPTIGSSAVESSVRMVLYFVELIAMMVWVAETGRGRA